MRAYVSFASATRFHGGAWLEGADEREIDRIVEELAQEAMGDSDTVQSSVIEVLDGDPFPTDDDKVNILLSKEELDAIMQMVRVGDILQ